MNCNHVLMMYQILCRLHWTSKARGHFEQLKGEDEIGLPNGLAWDEENLYHVDTVHQSISAYKTDSDGVPIRDDPNKPIQGKVVVKTDKKDGKLCNLFDF